METREDSNPALVPEVARQAGEVRDRWSWVEPCVWTERMLTALDEGVKGDKWFSLIDKVYRPSTLAQCVLCRTGVVLHDRSPRLGLSTPSGV